MSQRESSAADGSSPFEPSRDGATTNQLSPLTTPVSQYGTMEINDIPVKQASQEQEQQVEIIETPIEAPKPAVRRKIQQVMTGATYPKRVPPSSEKMLAINDTIQAIDQERSTLSLKNEQATLEKSTNNNNNNNNNELSLVMKQRPTVEDDLLQEYPSGEPTRPYPKKVGFIIANEFCERFSYYGLRTVLVLYFKSVLGFTDSGSTISFHLFATLCYLTPILGAILGDSILGKYLTIFYLSLVYCLGELILVISSIFWDLNLTSIIMTWVGLILIGIGTGGIKPCVAAFAGDQFLANETKWRENFFSLLYGSINLGSLISMFLTPLLRSNYGCVGRNDCYPYAFGLPCLLLFIATVVFVMASKQYYRAPLPKDNVIVAFCQCTWLALKRRLSGYKPPPAQRNAQLAGHVNQSLGEVFEDSSSSPNSSRLSMTSSENEAKPVAPSYKSLVSSSKNPLVISTQDNSAITGASSERKHWLYLASDRFDKNSIEQFRACLGIFLVFAPTPVYWCLFDQQGSLWTLQATRMDGRVFGTNFTLQPDQMMVANPLLLLTSIPIFQLLIYPALGKCNLITTPLQRMTTGGFIAALSFVASAIIEFQLQANQPHTLPMAGHANLLLVNGLSDCSLTNTTIHFVQPHQDQAQFLAAVNQTSLNAVNNDHSQALRTIEQLDPLTTQRINSLPTSNSSLVSYRLGFRLTNEMPPAAAVDQMASMKNQTSPTTFSSPPPPPPQPQPGIGCSFDPKQENELRIGPLPNQAVRLLYIDQGNGKLGYKLFNESLALPQANKARVRLLYEFFGSSMSAQQRSFHLISTGNNMVSKEIKFNMTTRDGQVLLSDYLDVEITPSSDQFYLRSNDSSLNLAPTASLKLKPGTRNLFILHQLDATSVKLKQELLQDNNYRISMLYQLIPYTMISMSEVMFSITALEFSYANAPPNFKSLILASVSITTAMGNILTVVIESWHPFSNLGHDFLFYAALMAADMILFAILGYQYEPYQPNGSRSSSARKLRVKD